MDNARLANVIFALGKKIPQSRYDSICESIHTDRLSLDECVFNYKYKDSLMDKVVFVLGDSTKVLISEDIFRSLCDLNTDKEQLIEFMSMNYDNFKNVIGLIENGNK